MRLDPTCPVLDEPLSLSRITTLLGHKAYHVTTHYSAADIKTLISQGVVFSDTYPITKAVAGLPGFGMPNPKSPITPDQFMQRLGTLPLMAQPGAQWLYTARERSTVDAGCLRVMASQLHGNRSLARFQVTREATRAGACHPRAPHRPRMLAWESAAPLP